jgi:hypothetical protein
LLAGVVLLLFGMSSVASAGRIDFTMTVTAANAGGSEIANISGNAIYAFLDLLNNGGGTGTATGYNDLSGTVSFGWGNLVDPNNGWGFEQWRWTTGSFFDVYSAATLIATASDVHFDLNINTSTGATTGYGAVTLGGPVDSPFYREVLAGSGGVLDMEISSFEALGLGDPSPYLVTGFLTSNSEIVPEPGPFALAGLAVLLTVLCSRGWLAPSVFRAAHPYRAGLVR